MPPGIIVLELVQRETLGERFSRGPSIPGRESRLGPQRRFCVLSHGPIAMNITDDGQRLLALRPAGEPVPNSIAVVLDWAEALAKN